MKSSMFNEQLATLCYCSANWPTDLNLNSAFNTRQCFRFTYFWIANCVKKLKEKYVLILCVVLSVG
jgi:hypothetical protein